MFLLLGRANYYICYKDNYCMVANVPSITLNQMDFMRRKKEKELVTVNGISVEIQPYMFPPSSPYSYSTKVLLENLDVKNKRVLEVGVGCGIISIFAAKQGAFVDGVDILPECVQFSLDNAIRNGVFEKTRFYYSDMFSNVDRSKNNKYDAIICNLPILNMDLPEQDSRWYSLFDPGFKFHNELFSKGKDYAKRIILAHADLKGKDDFSDLEKLAQSYGWYPDKVVETKFALQNWRNYEFRR